jgi:hypothetical protein
MRLPDEIITGSAYELHYPLGLHVPRDAFERGMREYFRDAHASDPYHTDYPSRCRIAILAMLLGQLRPPDGQEWTEEDAILYCEEVVERLRGGAVRVPNSPPHSSGTFHAVHLDAGEVRKIRQVGPAECHGCKRPIGDEPATVLILSCPHNCQPWWWLFHDPCATAVAIGSSSGG